MDQSSSGSRNPARKSIRCKEGNGDLKASGLIRGHSNPKWIRSREGAYLVLGIELLLELGDFSLLGGWEVLRIVPAHRFRPAACLPFFLFSTGREGGGNRREERQAKGWLLVWRGRGVGLRVNGRGSGRQSRPWTGFNSEPTSSSRIVDPSA